MLFEALQWILTHWSEFAHALQQHVLMCAIALAIGLVIGLPLAVLLLPSRVGAGLTVGLVNAIRTIPSIAILAAALPLLGIGLAPSVVALVVLAVPPILINSLIGLREIDVDVVDAATGMGMRRGEILWRIRLPLAAPSIFGGVRTAAVQVISGATLASFIGGGGLGDFITAGIAIMDFPRLLVGAVPIALLAIGVELGMAAAERALFAPRAA
ncbi:MAG: choline ABC transporter permease OpuBB [Acetobacteraceae bacterium]